MNHLNFMTIISGAILITGGFVAIMSQAHSLVLLTPPAAMFVMTTAWNRGLRPHPTFFLCAGIVAALIALAEGTWLTRPLTLDPAIFQPDTAPDDLERAGTLLNLAFRLSLACLAFYTGYFSVRAFIHSRTARKEDAPS